MFRKLISIFILFSFFLINAVAFSSAIPVKEKSKNFILDCDSEKTESCTGEEEPRLIELDEFLSPSLVLIHSQLNNKTQWSFFGFEPVRASYFSLPYPPPNFLA